MTFEKGHIYNFDGKGVYGHKREFLLRYRGHVVINGHCFDVLASNKESDSTNTLFCLHEHWITDYYEVSHINKRDLPLYINFYKTPLFDEELKGA